MTRLDFDPELECLGDALRASTANDLAREEHAARLASDGPGRRQGSGVRARWTRRYPRALAGGTLGLAGVGAALVIALSAGGATAPPAFAITTHSNGSVLVQLNHQEDLGQANQKLAAMGTDEQITLYLLPGPAAVSGPVSCTPGPGAGPANPPVQVLVTTGSASTGQSTGTTGEGTLHLACIVGSHTYTGPYPGNTANTRAG